MIVTENRRRRLNADKEIKDLDVGYWVIEVGGQRRKGWIESVDTEAGTATIAWDGGTVHDVVNFAMIRKIPARGHNYDGRQP